MKLFAVVGLVLLAALSGCADTETRPSNQNETGAPASDQEEQAAQLKEAVALLAQHETEAALIPLGKVTSKFETIYGSSTQRIYSVRTPQETLLYMLMATSDKVSAVAYSSIWVTAYQLQGYTLAELGRRHEARESLLKARRLAPMNALVLEELAYGYQIDKDSVQALEIFTKAEAATTYSPDIERKAELTRALRGQGFALTEMGRLSESESRYRHCLDIDPDDQKAKNELLYLAELRKKNQF